ncbi:OLC1v1004374C1 [Oldenlandia corymbosa var. corymbosa]|uniref:OLC1v1004374C1 n=1 Tax=Oldenlandia corymbosa var. corymbosa TaxID=529605 RepID=A0AAV1DC46_OLDCO|nr:OLC1v1004374C1 [Oldenlandia corymbosa var. corymbosa]
MSAVPEAAVTFLLQNISQVVAYYGSLIGNARSNVFELQRQLEELKRVMNDFSKYDHDSDVVKGVVKDIRDIIYEAEDAVDTFVLVVAAQKARNWVEKLYHKATVYPRQLVRIGESMKIISEKIQRIQDKGIQDGLQLLHHQAILKLSQPDDDSAFSEGEVKEPEVEQENVIGFDEAAQTVQELLTEGAEKLEVISIVGMLGLGKTTLATKVFKDSKVDYEFMIRKFVYVSREYKKKEVLLKMLESVTDVNENMRDLKLEQYRRLCINNINVMDYLSGRNLSGKRVRSFLTFVERETLVDPKYIPRIPAIFKLLRVLEAQSLIFARCPDISEVFEWSPKLRKLGIRGKVATLFNTSGHSEVFGYLRRLNYFRNLKLLNDVVDSPLSSLPMERCFPQKLMRLTLEKTLLEWKEMSILGKLEFLEVLKLKEYAFKGMRWDAEKDGFKNLKHLHIGRTDLVLWVWESQGEHFQNLGSLQLMGCFKLEDLPKGLADIHHLQSITLHSSNSKAAAKARKIQVLKLEAQQKHENANKSFTNLKLSIYPPDC